MICKVCKKKYTGSTSKWCSKSCYFKSYYKKNKNKLLKRRREWHKKYYKSHPIQRTKRTLEEKREYRKKYYEKHKEYYQNKNKEYYEKHKNDPEFRKRHNEATKKYLQKRREKGEKWWIKKKN